MCASGWCIDDAGWKGTCGNGPYTLPGGETATQLSIEKSKIKQLSDEQMIPYSCVYPGDCVDDDASCTSLKVLEQQGFLPKTSAGITKTIDNVITGSATMGGLCVILAIPSFTNPITAGLWAPCLATSLTVVGIGGFIFTKVSNWFNQRPDDVGLCVKSGGFCIIQISDIMEKIGLNLGCQTNTITLIVVGFMIFMLFISMSKR